MSDSSHENGARSSKTTGAGRRGLPEAGLRQVEVLARSLWDVARKGKAPKKSFGKAIGMPSASGGAFRTKLAALNGFNLIETDGEQLGLSELGLDLVQTSDRARKLAASRAAIEGHKIYQENLDHFEGTPLPSKEILASKFEFDYGRSSDVAEQAAEAFIDSLQFAGMVDADGIVRRSGGTMDQPNGSDRSGSERPSEHDRDHQNDRVEGARRSADHENGLDAELPMDKTSGRGSVDLHVSLDLSSFDVDDVLRVLKALGVAR